MAKHKKRRTAIAVIMTLSMIFSCINCAYALEDSQPSYLHSSYKNDKTVSFGSGDYLYSRIKITGSMMTEEQIFNIYELETIAKSSELNIAEKTELKINDKIHTVNGINLEKFLKLCGLADDASGDTVLQFFSAGQTESALTMKLSDIKEGKQDAVIAFSSDGKPLVSDKSSAGYDTAAQNSGGPAALCTGSGRTVLTLSEIRVSRQGSLSNPYYGLHLREPLDYMQSMEFTVNYVDKNKYTKTDDSAVPFKTVKYTMKQIEALIQENPEQVHGNYFGISGNEESKVSTGLGGFSDYFEGLDMGWFLSKKTGLKDTDGYAVFYGRDNDRFGTVKDLSYFFTDSYKDYYLELDNDTNVHGVIPVLAVSKNGYPLLPVHDHEIEGHVSYNQFNTNAIAAGYDTKIGIVKNVSGPFIAALPNLDGTYGGYRYETSGDCIRIDVYVNVSDYVSQSDIDCAKSLKILADAFKLS